MRTGSRYDGVKFLTEPGHLAFFGMIWLFIVFTGGVASADPGELRYRVHDDHVAIVGFREIDGFLEIPGTIDGLPVTTIEEDAFAIAGLTGVVVPDSVIEIKDGAFSINSRISSVWLGRGVEIIADSAFFMCRGLLEFVVHPDNPHFVSVDGVLFDKEVRTLESYPQGRIGGYVIPETVVRIDPFGFDSCKYLNSVILPNGLVEIGRFGIGYCEALTSIRIPASVRKINGFAFMGCENLEAMYFDGDAPLLEGEFGIPSSVGHIYYLPKTTMWSLSFGNRPTQMLPMIETDSPDFGIITSNGGEAGFGFSALGPANSAVIVEGSDPSSDREWQTVAENVFINDGGGELPEGTGRIRFQDPSPQNISSRIYRIRLP